MPTRLWHCLLILALAWTTPALALDRDVLLDQANILLLPRERAIPPLELVDQDGQRFDTRSLQGRWHILFFGFTACPDICPTTLSDMRRLFSQLPKETRDQLQLVLITADPARHASAAEDVPGLLPRRVQRPHRRYGTAAAAVQGTGPAIRSSKRDAGGLQRQP